MLVVDVLNSEMLELAAGRLEELKPGVDGLIPGAAILVEVGEPPLPLRLVVVKTAPELHLRLLDLVEDHLELGIHGA